ncbi:thioesterase family protein [Candidatus Pelagibacter bacterium nBUS_36]|uniref:thioesterase family protein n=1 Tax=Candidatus Pelagibacter bacterium nBUS_36 TaxID=3374194 RepID=UPI003EBDEF5B
MSVYLKSQKILNKWVDYNNHLNMAYYVLIFDEAWEVMLEQFKMGSHSAETTNRSTMVVETNTQYISEVKENDEVDLMLTFFDHDKKRLHLKLEMIEKKTQKLSATMEWISLYIDLDIRKVTEFENEKIKIMDEFIEKNKVSFISDDLKFSSKLKK